MAPLVSMDFDVSNTFMAPAVVLKETNDPIIVVTNGQNGGSGNQTPTQQ